MTNRRDDLRRLSRMLVDDTAFLDDLLLAMDDPDSLRKKYPSRWKRRGLGGARARLPADFVWLSFIDGLEARRRVVEVDHRSDFAEIRAACLALAEPPSVDAFDAIAAAADEAAVDPVLAALATELEPKGTALVRFERPWDAVAFAFVPRAAVAELVELARRAGFGTLRRIEPAPLVPKKAEPGAKRPRATPPRAPKAGAPATYRAFCTQHGFRNVEAVLYALQWRPEAAELLAQLRRAVPTAPAGERGRIECMLAMLEGSPAAVARDADDARTCFTAVDAVIRWVGKEAAGLEAAAVLVRRLGISADPAAMALPKGAGPWPWEPVPFSVVRFCVFPAERQADVARAFAQLTADDRELFQSFVRAGLASKEPGVVERSRMAERVVGRTTGGAAGSAEGAAPRKRTARR